MGGVQWGGDTGYQVTVTSPGSGIWFRVPSDDYMRKREKNLNEMK